MNCTWIALAQRVLEGHSVDRDEAMAILASDDSDILELMAGAHRLREHFFGKQVKLNVLINAQSGRCAEDCGYCSQSRFASTPIDEFKLVDEDAIVEGARQARAQRAGTYCIVMSGTKASERDVDRIGRAVRRIRAELPELKLCVSLGLINQHKAQELFDAGVDRFNHNINTSARHYSSIATTHRYEDRVSTIETIKSAGLSPCSGIICGMGETDSDLVEAAIDLRALDADSIPVNFLIPQPGTRLEKLSELTPMRCLRILAMFRFLNPDKEIRLSAGRELHLGTLQPLALFAANSIFLGDYLTSEGQDREEDYRMIRELGFEIENDPTEPSLNRSALPSLESAGV